jgi:hypothetical protein
MTIGFRLFVGFIAVAISVMLFGAGALIALPSAYFLGRAERHRPELTADSPLVRQLETGKKDGGPVPERDRDDVVRRFHRDVIYSLPWRYYIAQRSWRAFYYASWARFAAAMILGVAGVMIICGARRGIGIARFAVVFLTVASASEAWSLRQPFADWAHAIARDAAAEREERRVALGLPEAAEIESPSMFFASRPPEDMSEMLSIAFENLGDGPGWQRVALIVFFATSSGPALLALLLEIFGLRRPARRISAAVHFHAGRGYEG